MVESGNMTHSRVFCPSMGAFDLHVSAGRVGPNGCFAHLAPSPTLGRSAWRHFAGGQPHSKWNPPPNLPPWRAGSMAMVVFHQCVWLAAGEVVSLHCWVGDGAKSPI